MKTRALPLVTALLSLSALARTPAAETEDSPVLAWTSVEKWGVEGQGWLPEELAARYDRLPAKAEKIVRPPVWNLSRDSAGISFRFNTDATEIHIRYTVGDRNLAMPHMPATGVSGVDLYALDSDGAWKWVSVSRPGSVETEFVVRGLDPGMRSRRRR